MKINDKHIEVIVRQMLRRSRSRSGDARFIPGEQVERSELLGRNDRSALATRPAHLHRLLLRHPRPRCRPSRSSRPRPSRKPPRSDRSGDHAAKDDLRGLKENVIVGRLIPAGTGLAYHRARVTFEGNAGQRWFGVETARGGTA